MSACENPDRAQIQFLQQRLDIAEGRNRQYQSQIRLLASSTEDLVQRSEILLEQLTKAYSHLQHIYLARCISDQNEHEILEVGMWLESLKDVVGEDIFSTILQRSQWLDRDKQMGRRNTT